jgi:hypothetical protein
MMRYEFLHMNQDDSIYTELFNPDVHTDWFLVLIHRSVALSCANMVLRSYDTVM